MTEPNQQDRLAALAARSKPSPETAGGRARGAAKKTPRSRPSPSTRLAAAGASLVSFASMVAAMGPLTAQATQADSQTTVEDPADDVATPPQAPQVVIEIVPHYVSANGTPLTADQLALLTASSTVTDPGEGTTDLLAPSEAPSNDATRPAPTTAPATAGPVSTVPPPTSPATTTAPIVTTAAPTTAAPVTAPPTTNPPPPAPDPTPPPRSEGSG